MSFFVNKSPPIKVFAYPSERGKTLIAALWNSNKNHSFSSQHLNVSVLFLAPHLRKRQRRLELHPFQKGLHHSSRRFPLQWARQICIHALRSVFGHWHYRPAPHLPASFCKGGNTCEPVGAVRWLRKITQVERQTVGRRLHLTSAELVTLDLCLIRADMIYNSNELNQAAADKIKAFKQWRKSK